LEGKKKGEIRRLVNPNYLGVGQIGELAMPEGIAWARKNGVNISNSPDPRLKVTTCVVLVTAVLGHIAGRLKDTFDVKKISELEKRKMLWASYNSTTANIKSHLNSINQMNIRWKDIESMTPSQTQDYVRNILFRLDV
jgi:hypothetical protein